MRTSKNSKWKTRGIKGLYLLGIEYHQEPLITFKMGPREEEFEFLVDMGAERSCVCKIPKGCEKNQDTVQVVGAKGEWFKALVVKQV